MGKSCEKTEIFFAGFAYGVLRTYTNTLHTLRRAVSGVFQRKFLLLATFSTHRTKPDRIRLQPKVLVLNTASTAVKQRKDLEDIRNGFAIHLPQSLNTNLWYHLLSLI